MPGDERLIREREHGRLGVADGPDRRAERAAHAALVLGVDDMPAAQAVERGNHLRVFVSDDHQHVIEPGFRHLPHRPPDQGLAAQRQQELGGAHPRGCTGSEDDGGNHGVIVAAAVLR